MIRIVADTNVLVSALLYPERPIGFIVELLQEGSIGLVYSDATLQELKRVMERLKFDPATVSELIDLIQIKGIFVQPKESIRKIKEDPTDNKFLEAAVAGQARFVVSGDGHLKALRFYQGVAVVTPAEFLKFLLEP